MKNKKGASLWVAWVLLIVFVVAMGGLIGNWMFENTKRYVQSFKEKTNTEECNYLFLRVEDICQDLSSLKVTLSNPSGKSVTGFKVILFDIYGNLNTKIEQFKLARSTYNQKMQILKDDVLDSVELIPFFDEYTEDGVIRTFCQNKKIFQSKVRFCDQK